MEQVNTFGLFLLGKWLDSIFLHAKMPLKVNPAAWYSARSLLDMLITGDAKLKLNESAVAALNLRALIDQALSGLQSDPEFTMTEPQVAVFNSAWGVFEQALALDLGRAPIFFVTQTGIYSTPELITRAEQALMDDVAKTVSKEAKQDLNQAGRCLAFELSTASGYHALRATEKVLREYYALVLKKPPKRRGMKQCIDALENAGTDKKTMAALDQLRDLHRNPLDHPEEFLEKAEALELFNACTNAISKMARQMAVLNPPQSTP